MQQINSVFGSLWSTCDPVVTLSFVLVLVHYAFILLREQVQVLVSLHPPPVGGSLVLYDILSFVLHWMPAWRQHHQEQRQKTALHNLQPCQTDADWRRLRTLIMYLHNSSTQPRNLWAEVWPGRCLDTCQISRGNEGEGSIWFLKEQILRWMSRGFILFLTACYIYLTALTAGHLQVYLALD